MFLSLHPRKIDTFFHAIFDRNFPPGFIDIQQIIYRGSEKNKYSLTVSVSEISMNTFPRSKQRLVHNLLQCTVKYGNYMFVPRRTISCNVFAKISISKLVIIDKCAA